MAATASDTLIVTGLTSGALEGQPSNGGQDAFLASFKLLPSVSASFNTSQILENSSSDLVLTFQRSGSVAEPLAIWYSLGGTAESSDYVGAQPAAVNSIQIPAGQKEVSIAISPLADGRAEPTETIAATLLADANYVVGAGAAPLAQLVDGWGTQPIASFTGRVAAVSNSTPLTGRLTSINPAPLDGVAYQLLTGAPAGFVLSANGSWSFDPSHPSLQGLAPGERRSFNLAYSTAPIPPIQQPSLPATVIRVGGPASAFSSLQQALDQSPAGSVIYVAPGTYTENLKISKSVSLLGAFYGVSAQAQQRGSTGAESIIQGFIDIEATAANVSIDGMTLLGTAARGVNMRVQAPSSNLSNTIITSVKPSGGYSDFAFVKYTRDSSLSGFTSIDIQDNKFNGIVDYSATPVVIQINRAASATIEGNHFENTGGGGNIVIAENAGDILIRDNFMLGGGKGIAAYSGVFDKFRIENNTILNTNLSGIEFNGTDIRSGNLSGNIVNGSGIDITGKGLRYANLSVGSTARLANAFQITNNDLSQPFGSNVSYQGVQLTGAVNQVARDSSIATFRLDLLGPEASASPAAVTLASSLDSQRLRVTPFAQGLGYPSSMADLEDGSILAATTTGDPLTRSPFGTTPSQLIRLADTNGDGQSDVRQVLATPPGFVTSLRRVGTLIFALSSGRLDTAPCITIYRTGASASSPLTELARLTLNFPAEFLSGGNPHTSYALAARVSPTEVNAIELYFNLGARDDNQSTSPALQVGITATGAATFQGGSMPADSLQRLILRDQGSSLAISAPQTIATGLRNAAGLDFDLAGNLYLEDNGFNLDPTNSSPPTSPDTSFSSDELNRVTAEEIGINIPDFGFAESYVRYANGAIVNASSLYREPLLSFLPVNGQRSEGAVEIATAPTGFPSDFAQTVFTAFFGKFGVGSANNDENPIVAADIQSKQKYHFINPSILGNPSGVLAFEDDLYLADYSSTGFFFGSSNGTPADQAGAIYRVSPKQPVRFRTLPRLDASDAESATLSWVTDGNAVSSLELWGGSIAASKPRVFTATTSQPAGSLHTTSITLTGLEPGTDYAFRVRLGEQTTQASFRTAPGPTPSPLWTRQPGSSLNDVAYAVVAGADGNLYLGGAMDGSWNGHTSRGSSDAFLSRYRSDGTLDWTAWLDTDQTDALRTLAVAADGSILAAGSTLGSPFGIASASPGASDGFLSRYSPNGTRLWTRLLGASGWDMIHGVTSLAGGDILATGYTSSTQLAGQASLGTVDAFVARYSADGELRWLTRLGGGGFDYGMHIAAGSDGAIYLTGFSSGSFEGQPNSGGSDSFLSRLDPLTGRPVWTRMLATPQDDFGEDLTLGSDGDIYVATSSDGSLGGNPNQGSRDVFLSRFAADGSLRWTRGLGSAGLEEARSLITAADGSILMSGHSRGSLGEQTPAGGDEGFVSAFAPDGRRLWTRLVGTPGDDLAWGVAALPDGDLAVAGEVGGSLDGSTPAGGQDAFLQRLGGGGTRLLVTPDGRTIRFDPLRYVASNPDLITAFGADANAAAWHYVNWGFAEGRRLDGFDPSQYLAGSDALIGRFGSDTTAATRQYITEGFAAGTPADSFDEFRYIASNPSLISSFRNRPADAAAHYLSTGRSQGLARSGFDPLRYIASYPDLITAFGADSSAGSWHYINWGLGEGRRPDGFDPLRYIASYPDLITAFGADASAGSRHYINWGFNEGRRPDGFDPSQYLAGSDALIGRFGSDTAAATRQYITEGFAAGTPADSFDEYRYIASNPSLISSFRNRPADAAAHYLSTGRSQGLARSGFDPLQYVASYPDLIAAFRADPGAGSWHYINWGFNEGRSPDLFNEQAYLAAHPELQTTIGLNASALAAHRIASALI